MSCNGCRVLRKGCSETCMLRPSLQWIESPEAQGHATVFVAKFFGRAGLMSFLSSVPEPHRPALFQSLLFEACGRTVNPVNGAVGLLWTGNWHVCQTAVETVLRGGTLRPLPESLTGSERGGLYPSLAASDEASEACTTDATWKLRDANPNHTPSSHHCRFSNSRSKASPKRKRSVDGSLPLKLPGSDLDLRLTPSLSQPPAPPRKAEVERRRPGTPSTMNSEESVTTFATCLDSRISDLYGGGAGGGGGGGERKLLNLFV